MKSSDGNLLKLTYSHDDFYHTFDFVKRNLYQIKIKTILCNSSSCL